MGLIFRLAELLLLIVPLIGVGYATWKGISAARGQRTDPPIQHEQIEPEPGRKPSIGDQAAQWRAVARTVEEHNRIDTRWLSYELDPATLLDYPLMTDMREPKVVDFHRAKLRADLLKPARAEDLVDDRESASAYLSAVEDYATAFTVAESEARRRRRDDYSPSDQQRLVRAQGLLGVATDDAATQPERERAYELARKELDGLVVLPDNSRAAIERGIAGELEE